MVYLYTKKETICEEQDEYKVTRFEVNNNKKNTRLPHKHQTQLLEKQKDR